MIMFHGDDKGLVLPPAVAPVQVVIVPIYFGKDANDQTNAHCRRLADNLTALGVRVELDDRTNYNPGWKFNHWELRGVPIRLEVGPQDVQNEQVCVRSISFVVALVLECLVR